MGVTRRFKRNQQDQTGVSSSSQLSSPLLQGDGIAPGSGNGHARSLALASQRSSPLTSLRAERRIRRLHDALSDLDRRQNLSSRYGVSHYDTSSGSYKRKLYDALGYIEELSVDFYRDQYERGGIAERIIEAYPRGTWGGGFAVIEDPDPDVETPFEAAVNKIFTAHNVVSRLMRADILAGMGRYSVLVVGEPGGNLESELPRLSGPGQIIYLTPRAEDHAKIHKEVEDSSDPRFGLPLSYKIKLGKKRASAALRATHWTRVIHVAEGLLEDDIYGKPRLRAVWNRLHDLEKILGGGAEAAWKRMDPGLHIDINPEIEIDSTEEDAMEDEIDDYLHGVSRIMQTRGGKVTPLSAAVTAFGVNAKAVIEQIAGTTGIPQRILLGSERGELASSQDRGNWADRIMERREEFAKPLISQLVGRLIDHGAIPEPAEPWEVQWPETDVLTEMEKSEIVASYAEANRSNFEAGQPPVISSDEIRDRVLSMKSLEDAGVDVAPPVPENTDGEDGSTTTDLRGLAESFELTDSPPREPDWKAVHRAADAHRDVLQSLFVERWADLESNFPSLPTETGAEITLESALRDAGEQTAGAVIENAISTLNAALREDLTAWLNIILIAGGEAAARVASARGSFFRRAASPLKEVSEGVLEGKINGQAVRAVLVEEGPERAGSYWRLSVNGQLRSHFRTREGVNHFASRILGQTALPKFVFDSANPRALAYAAARSAELVTEITPDTIAALKKMVARGFEEGIPPRKLARQIRRSVGLRSDQITAVDNLFTELIGSEPGTVVTRFPAREGVREAAGFRVRVPDKPTAEWAEAQSSRYAKMQRNYRARTIARTETLRSANAGQKELWLQARDRGNIPADQLREWIVTPDARLRLDHAEMEDVRVRIDEDFQAPDGSSEPGEAPNCRCGQGLVDEVASEGRSS